VALFIYRVLLFAVDPDDLSPVLWVVMGAAAISTNAGRPSAPPQARLRT